MTPRAGLPPYAYRWSEGETLSAISGLKSGDYTIQVTDSKGCIASREISMGESPPLLSQSTACSKLCNGEINGILEFQAVGGTMPYKYSIDNGIQFQMAAMVQNLPLGNYTILIHDVNDCETRQNIMIPQSEVIELFPPEAASIPLGKSIYIDIQTNTIEALIYEWMPETGVACTSFPETEILPLINTIYTIRATDLDGCRWATDWSVEVYKESDVYIPNAFSLNGDGRNDFFTIYTGLSVVQIQNLQIFDRWGDLRFQAGNCLSEERNCLWDRRTRGQLLGEGVYIYSLTVEYIDRETESFSGDVVLIK